MLSDPCILNIIATYPRKKGVVHETVYLACVFISVQIEHFMSCTCRDIISPKYFCGLYEKIGRFAKNFLDTRLETHGRVPGCVVSKLTKKTWRVSMGIFRNLWKILSLKIFNLANKSEQEQMTGFSRPFGKEI